MPLYDFKTSTYTGFKIIKPKKYIIIDGILLFSNLEILKQLDLCVYIDCDDNTFKRDDWHIDTVERGATHDMVKHQLNTTVNPMFYKYVFPNRHYADIVFNNTQITELIIYRKNYLSSIRKLFNISMMTKMSLLF